MMTVGSPARYGRHGAHRENQRYEILLTLLLFASVGAVTWAVRGTTGWGGIDGTIVPGLAWGILWYYLCWRKGIDARSIPFWLGMGVAIGGELGYGIYVSWIWGDFRLNGEVIPVSPWAGHLGFAICGIGWAAPGGVVLGWVLAGPARKGQWAARTILMVLLLAVILSGSDIFGTGIVEATGAWFAKNAPGLLFPNAHLGIYDGELGDSQGRILYTNTQNFLVLLWWIAATVTAAVQRDRTTVITSLLLGLGFGIGFPLSALWCYGYSYAPQAVDWWKMWELHSGVNLGIIYAIAYFWSLRHVTPNRDDKITHFTTQQSGILMACGGFALIFVAGHEYFLWTGLAVAVFFALVMLYATFGFGSSDTKSVVERQLRGLLIFSVFFLLFMLCHGVTSRLGVVFGIYGDDEIGQYRWPAGRIALFAPMAALLAIGALGSLARAFHPASLASESPAPADSPWSMRVFDLIMFIGVVGAASIWPAKIGVAYAVFTGLAIVALVRLNRHFDAIDRGQTARLSSIPQDSQ